MLTENKIVFLDTDDRNDDAPQMPQSDSFEHDVPIVVGRCYEGASNSDDNRANNANVGGDNGGWVDVPAYDDVFVAPSPPPQPSAPMEAYATPVTPTGASPSATVLPRSPPMPTLEQMSHLRRPYGLSAPTADHNGANNDVQDSAANDGRRKMQHRCRRTTRWVHWGMCWCGIVARDTGKFIHNKGKAALKQRADSKRAADRSDTETERTIDTAVPVSRSARDSEATNSARPEMDDTRKQKWKEWKMKGRDQSALMAGIVVSASTHHAKRANRKMKSCWRQGKAACKKKMASHQRNASAKELHAATVC